MYNGSLVLLYLKDGETWSIVGGLRTTKFSFSSNLIEANITNEHSWKDYLNEIGTKSLIISVSGAFTNSKAENIIQELAFSGKIADYKLVFPVGNHLTGSFMISNYIRIANMEEEESYSLTLNSSGKIFFVS